MRYAAACWLIGLTASLLSVVARAEDRMMVLTVDLTREGKKITPPTPENPTYYVPVFLGYKERGVQAQHFYPSLAAEQHDTT